MNLIFVLVEGRASGIFFVVDTLKTELKLFKVIA